mmetsp:Transcript_15789/g.31474  ORF Transcript_15789/g.31474 Transcript_15789/m.31474 type:complete len:248 (-) Transcript_15789:49-792(-)
MAGFVRFELEVEVVAEALRLGVHERAQCHGVVAAAFDIPRSPPCRAAAERLEVELQSSGRPLEVVAGGTDVKQEGKLRRRIQTQLLPAAQEHRTDVELHAVPHRGDEVAVGHECALDGPHEESVGRRGKTHGGGAATEAGVVHIRPEHPGDSVGLTVTFQPLPDGRAVIQRRRGRVQLQGGAGVFHQTRGVRQQGTGLRRRVVVCLGPGGSRLQVDVAVGVGFVQVPRKVLEVDALAGRRGACGVSL